MTKNVLICGVGGQGTVLAAKVLSQAALSKGKQVLSAETIGMAQRGGSVTSHVRIGKNAFSPLIPAGRADIIIAFEAAEAVRNISFLKKGGTVVVNDKIVQPTTASILGKSFDAQEMLDYLEAIKAKVICVDAEKISAKLGSSKAVNMILLGAASRTGLVSKEEILSALKILVKPEFLSLNQKAVEEGARADNAFIVDKCKKPC
ncbi:MAG: indolepyruvate oxidoreductase subunit beta [Treponema sp.]|nr:indolepyruvate oxidoreductase subunit beta [Treponema sp.]